MNHRSLKHPNIIRFKEVIFAKFSRFKVLRPLLLLVLEKCMRE